MSSILNLDFTLSIPDLWSGKSFHKKEWGPVNYLVGPNATGKSRFAEQLKKHCQARNLRPRYISTERLAGLERSNYSLFTSTQLHEGLHIGRFRDYRSYGAEYGLVSDAFATIKERLDIRIKIEATLSQLFSRRIRLAEEGGYLNPKIQRADWSTEYGLRENECHGLKELITLLTFLYDDQHDCLIIDEPELHLHPQFQAFLLHHIKTIAGNPLTDSSKKTFFLVTHSPYFLDIRTIDDLKHCIVFHLTQPPTYIDQLDTEDEWRIIRLLPRLNTHHKQFFFSPRPIFVEGYHDQQLFSLIQEKRGMLSGASGASIIDVGGKDELDLFFRLCRKLQIDAQFITDLDTLTRGKLRQSVSEDERSRTFLQKSGIGTHLMDVLGQAEQKITDCYQELKTKVTSGPSLESDALADFVNAMHRTSELDKERYLFLVALNCAKNEIVESGHVKSSVEFAEGDAPSSSH